MMTISMIMNTMMMTKEEDDDDDDDDGGDVQIDFCDENGGN